MLFHNAVRLAQALQVNDDGRTALSLFLRLARKNDVQTYAAWELAHALCHLNPYVLNTL